MELRDEKRNVTLRFFRDAIGVFLYLNIPGTWDTFAFRFFFALSINILYIYIYMGLVNILYKGILRNTELHIFERVLWSFRTS